MGHRPGAFPHLLHEEKPSYTKSAMRRRAQGTVHMNGYLADDGTVRSVCIVESLDPELDLMAMSAARRWRFTPLQAASGDVPITIYLAFKLR